MSIRELADDGVHDAAPHRGTVEIILRRKFVSARGGFPDLAPYASMVMTCGPVNARVGNVKNNNRAPDRADYRGTDRQGDCPSVVAEPDFPSLLFAMAS